MLEWLVQLDKATFRSIQSQFHAGWLDAFMLFIREAYVWIPLYGFMLYWSLRRGTWIAIKFIMLTLLCFAITDFTSASILKPIFERLRPCYDPDTAGVVRGLIGCGGKFGFPSSHAANHFGLAAFWYGSIHFISGQKWSWLWVWALAVGVAQVYVGKHFPLDIAGGAILGLLAGWVCCRLFMLWVRTNFNRSMQDASLN